MKSLYHKTIGSEMVKVHHMIFEQRKTDLSCTNPSSRLVHEAFTKQVQRVSRSRGEELAEGSARELSYGDVIGEFSMALRKSRQTVSSSRGGMGRSRTGQSSSVGVPSARKMVFNWSMSDSPGR